MNYQTTSLNRSDASPLLQAILASKLLPVAVIDAKGIFTNANDAFCKLFAHNQSDICGKTYELLFKSPQINKGLFSHNGKNKGNTGNLIIDQATQPGMPLLPNISYEWISDEICLVTALQHERIPDDISQHFQTTVSITGNTAVTHNLSFSVGRNFKLLSASPEFLNYLKETYGVLVKPGDNIFQKNILPGNFMEAWNQVHSQVFNGLVYEEEIYMPATANKKAAWIHVSFRPVYESGLVTGINCFTKNITERKMAGGEIIENELRLAEVQEMAKIGTWETDLLTFKVTCSPESYRIFGTTNRIVTPSVKTFFSFVHPADRQKIIKTFKLTLSKRGVNYLEHRIITPSGKVKIVEQSWRIYRNAAGDAARAVGICQDVTRRREDEERIRESEFLYRSLIEQATDTICITDASLNIIDINASGCRATGYTREELLKLSIPHLLFKEDLVKEPIKMRALLAGETINSERRIKRKDGSWIHVELNGKQRPDGKIIYFVRDISSWKQSEKYLKESNERLDLISRASNDMVWDWDLLTGKVYRNKEGWRKIFRSTSIDDTGSSSDWNSRLHPEDVKEVNKIGRQVRKSKNNFYEIECRVRRDDGTYAFVHDRGYVIRNEEGKAIRLIGAAQDITDRKEATLKLEKSELHFRLLIQNSSDLVSILNKKGSYLYCSLAVQSILGYQPEEMTGKNAFSFIHPEDVFFIKKQFAENNNGKRFEIMPLRFKNKKGEWRWLESTVTDMCGNPEVKGFVFNSRDVTDKIIAAEEIMKLSMIVKEMPNAVIITSSSGEIIWVNEAFTTITEYEKTEVLDKKPGDFLRGTETDAATIKYLEYQLNLAIPFECDMVNYAKSGRKYWLRIQCQPQFDGQGKLKNFFIIATDISKEKETEDVLRKSEERYRFLFDNNPSSVVIWDIESLQVIEINEASVALYGYSRMELIGMPLLHFLHPDEHAGFKKLAEAARDNIRFRHTTTQKRLNKNGSEMYINTVSHRINYNGKPVMLAIGNNVTDKLQIEKILEAERLLRQKQITEAVISAQEHERQELGRELHDNVNQVLASSLLYVGLAKAADESSGRFLSKSATLIQLAIEDVRNLSHSLIPPSLQESSLLASLSSLAENVMQTSAINTELNFNSIDESQLSENLRLSIFRIVQEQITNILKHADATKMILELITQDGKLLLNIIDDGKGFDFTEKTKGVGLMNIRTRAALFNGNASIISSPGNGCELKVYFDICS